MDRDALEKELWRVNWKQHGYPFCGIYAISPDNRWPTKIGISQNPVRRLITLQSAHWKKLDVAEYRYAANFAAARKIETKVHETLHEDGKSLQGEWFDIRPEAAVELIEFSALTLGIEINSRVPTEEVRDALHVFCSKANTRAHIALMEGIYGDD